MPCITHWVMWLPLCTFFSPVAICTRSEMEDFLREAACMKEFDHPNVMRLLGELAFLLLGMSKVGYFKLQKVVFFSNLHLMTHSHSGLEISVCIQLKTLKAFVAQIYSEFCVRAKENRAIEQILCVVVIVCCFFRWRHLFKYTFKTFGIKSKMMLISE